MEAGSSFTLSADIFAIEVNTPAPDPSATTTTTAAAAAAAAGQRKPLAKASTVEMSKSLTSLKQPMTEVALKNQKSTAGSSSNSSNSEELFQLIITFEKPSVYLRIPSDVFKNALKVNTVEKQSSE